MLRLAALLRIGMLSRQVYGAKNYDGSADLYVYFYYRALQLLKNNGVFVFISSNK